MAKRKKAAGDPLPFLVTAGKALHASDFAAARDALIEAWRRRRSPILADLVEVVAEKAPDVLASQLAALITPRVATTHANLTALAGVDDPRLSRWAIDALVQLPFTTETARTFLLDLVATAERLGDIRLAERVNEIEVAVRTRINRLSVRNQIVGAVRRAEIDQPAEPSTAEVKAWNELRKLIEPLRKAQRSVDALLADIYANPADDAPRLVLADLLLERGDPRGELITLQLERKGEPTERERQLLKKHGKAWMGALAPVLSWGRGYAHTEFRRGFVAKADIILSVGKKLDPIRNDPAWATVEELLGSWDWDLLAQAPLNALRTIERPVPPEMVSRLSYQPLPAVTTIRIGDPEAIDPAMLHAAFPALHTVKVWHRADASKKLAALGELEVPCISITDNWSDDFETATRDFEVYLAALLAKPAPTQRLELERPSRDRTRGPVVALVRGDDGRFTVS